MITATGSREHVVVETDPSYVYKEFVNSAHLIMGCVKRNYKEQKVV